MMKILPLFPLALGLLWACAPASTPPTVGVVTEMPNISPPVNPYAPRPADAALSRGVVFLDSAQVLVMESNPAQISVGLEGNLPTPCHELRAAVSAPDASNMIAIEVYSVFDPNLACIQVLKPLNVTLPLGAFPKGHFTVRVNGRDAGEFDV